MIDKDFGFRELRAINKWARTEAPPIEIVRARTMRNVDVFMSQANNTTLLKIAQHDISKARDEARPSSPHCGRTFCEREIKSRAGCTDRHQKV